MAYKQACDPYRSEDGQGVVFVQPGKSVTKGDFVARSILNSEYAVSIKDIDTVANAIAGFYGVANNGVTTTQSDRRLVVNARGNYQYPLTTAAQLLPGDLLTFVLEGGVPAAQKWVKTATANEQIAKVVKQAPPLDGAVRDLDPIPTIFAINTSTETMTLTVNPFRVGDTVKITNSTEADGAVLWATSGVLKNVLYYVIYSSGLDIRVSTTANGAASTPGLGGTLAGTNYVNLSINRGTATEAEGRLVSKLL